ncbi:MAG: hypothetical protein WCX31_13900 [Salinivirgaceae bacterium]
MKRPVKNTGNKKQNFGQFAKLTVNQMIKIQGGTDEIPPEEEQPIKV